MKEYIIGVPDDEPLSSLRRSGKTITAIAKITCNCDDEEKNEILKELEAERKEE